MERERERESTYYINLYISFVSGKEGVSISRNIPYNLDYLSLKRKIINYHNLPKKTKNLFSEMKSLKLGYL